MVHFPNIFSYTNMFQESAQRYLESLFFFLCRPFLIPFHEIRVVSVIVIVIGGGKNRTQSGEEEQRSAEKNHCWAPLLFASTLSFFVAAAIT